MKRLLPILLLVAAVGCQRVDAQPQTQTNDCQTCPVDQRDCDTCPVLPEDGRSWYFTLMLNEGWRKRVADRRLIAWVYGSPTIMAVKSQCHVSLYTPTNAIYRDKFAKSFDGHLPGLLIQRDDGVTAFKLLRNNAPVTRDLDQNFVMLNRKGKFVGHVNSAGELARRINLNVRLFTPHSDGPTFGGRRRERCDGRQEEEVVEPDIVDESSIAAEPVVTPPVQSDGPWMWVAIAALVALFLCVVGVMCTAGVGKMLYLHATKPFRSGDE